MVAQESYYRTSLETELERYSKLRVEDIATIQKWLTTQPHLPPVFGTIAVNNVL